MKKVFENKLYYIFVVLLCVFSIQVVGSVKQKSATYDEPFYLWTGYIYLKTGKIVGELQSPMFMRTLSALFLSNLNLSLLMDEQTPKSRMDYDKRFLYKNNKKPETIIFWGRVPIIILGIVLGFFVFWWAKLLYGVSSGIFALFLYTFSPNILAHTRIATTDLGVTCFIFISLFCFWMFLNKEKIKYLVLSGFMFGFAITSKFSAVLLIPIYTAFLIHYFWKKNILKNFIKTFYCVLIILISAFVVILTVYRVSSIDYFFKGFVETMIDIKKGREVWFLCKYSKTGFWYYYPLIFLIKTPISVSIFFIFTLLYTLIKKKLTIHGEGILVLAVILFFIAAMLSHKQLGLRYVLPIYPIIFVISSKIVNINFCKKWKINSIIGILSIFLIYSTTKIYPHYMAYANEIIKPQNLYKYSPLDIDSGEDLRLLSEFVKKEQPAKLYLGYFGTEIPRYYFDYQDLFSSNDKIINQLGNKEFLAVSVLWLQDIFSNNSISPLAWLKNYKIKKNLGYSIFVYDITNDINAHCHIAQYYLYTAKFQDSFEEYKNVITFTPDYKEAQEGLCEAKRAFHYGTGLEYQKQKRYDIAIKEFRKAIEINYQHPAAHNALGVVYAIQGMNEKALKEFEVTLKIDPEYSPAIDNYKKIQGFIR